MNIVSFVWTFDPWHVLLGPLPVSDCQSLTIPPSFPNPPSPFDPTLPPPALLPGTSFGWHDSALHPPTPPPFILCVPTYLSQPLPYFPLLLFLRAPLPHASL